ncbi:amidohydrolase family protein [Thalassobaculum sp.]|uniref:amidohydrolase family protein n=1 Tax=Thalassobaculum sp. TaxID=2022740 RepID=UPI0032EE0B8B
MIDAHHHIWLQKDLPWLLGPEQPRIFGPYAAIKRDYEIEEFLGDITGLGISKSVYVQANWPVDRFEDEVAWVQSVADARGWPHAIVGYADFTEPDIRPQLERLKGYPLMRGIRQQFHWHRNPLYRFAARPDLASDPTVRKNIARLADYGWSFDLQVFADQMQGAARLAAACPEVTFILQHAGMLEDTTEAGISAWSDGMARLADCPNVVSKLSGFGTFIHRNDPGFIARMIAETVGIFGADRCLFGSNFPIEKIWVTYDDLLSAFQAGAARLTTDQRKAIFEETAQRIYRI